MALKLTNCLISKGIFIDEPALSKSNLDPCCVKIEELNGSWNCQIRFGALYLANAKVLHFCSKKNMPVSRLSEKNFLKTVKLMVLIPLCYLITYRIGEVLWNADM